MSSPASSNVLTRAKLANLAAVRKIRNPSDPSDRVISSLIHDRREQPRHKKKAQRVALTHKVASADAYDSPPLPCRPRGRPPKNRPAPAASSAAAAAAKSAAAARGRGTLSSEEEDDGADDSPPRCRRGRPPKNKPAASSAAAAAAAKSAAPARGAQSEELEEDYDEEVDEEEEELDEDEGDSDIEFISATPPPGGQRRDSAPAPSHAPCNSAICATRAAAIDASACFCTADEAATWRASDAVHRLGDAPDSVVAAVTRVSTAGRADVVLQLVQFDDQLASRTFIVEPSVAESWVEPIRVLRGDSRHQYQLFLSRQLCSSAAPRFSEALAHALTHCSVISSTAAADQAVPVHDTAFAKLLGRITVQLMTSSYRQ